MTASVSKWLGNIENNIPAAANKLGSIRVENNDFEESIRKYDSDNTLFYLDPPYVPDTRTFKKGYKYELSIEDHERLVDILLTVKGKVILSGYDNEIYRRLETEGKYKKILIKEAVKSSINVNREERTGKEYVWINYDIEDDIKEMSYFCNDIVLGFSEKNKKLYNQYLIKYENDSLPQSSGYKATKSTIRDFEIKRNLILPKDYNEFLLKFNGGIVKQDIVLNDTNIKGDIKFEDVSFSYNDELVLKNINLDIKAGSTVAIMGTTGSGKSTLLNLIGRYYDVKEGSIKVDNVDVKNYDLEVLRSSMAIVPQDTFLFSDSILNNIKFSNENADIDEAKKYSKLACSLDFIEALEEGFNTEIGERGIGLSGGQKQRISISRALIRNSSILILDDSTSALDMETEQELLTNLSRMEKQSTTFIVAHRISAVKNSDLIVYLEDGEIKEKGTHEELLELKGAYYDIYCEQFKDFNVLEKEVI